MQTIFKFASALWPIPVYGCRPAMFRVSEPEYQINSITISARVTGVFRNQLCFDCAPEIAVTAFLDLHRNVGASIINANVGPFVIGVRALALSNYI